MNEEARLSREIDEKIAKPLKMDTVAAAQAIAERVAQAAVLFLAAGAAGRACGRGRGS